MHVEVLDEDRRAVPEGRIGRLVVTTGTNPARPLLRYDTGDRGAVVRHQCPEAPGSTECLITALEGCATVRYRDAAGAWVPSVSLTQVLQGADGALEH